MILLNRALNVIVDEAPKIIDIKYNKITCDTFTLVFNKPISFNPSQSSATRNHLFIHEFNKNELIPIGSFVSEDYTKIKVVPKQKLKSSCNYTLSIDSISDNSDNLMLPYEFNFTTNAVIVDLGSQNALEILSIWPNPAQGIINVKVPYEFDSNNLRVEFVNIDGKVIQPISIENSSIIVINISNLKNGNYYLKVSDHSKILAKQVIIKNK